MLKFRDRHIGPDENEVNEMLKVLGFSQLEEMAQKVIPAPIRSKHDFKKLGTGQSEYELLSSLKSIMSKNKVHQSLIGMGFYNTITPSVIQRNILENPAWYTAYTPYQPEISQGRLEALLNFQTMICDLTGMEIANSSLLDEGSAAAEAMTMAHSLSSTKSDSFVVSPLLHPHVIEVLKTRSEPLGLKMILQEPSECSAPVFAVFVQYPATDGSIIDFEPMTQRAHEKGSLVVACADLLALTLLKPPGEWGADIVVGNSQRFGVPLGNGGPHAAFMATKDTFKRLMPGRLVGVSIDSHGKRALRLTLQTREQHIRREKATSNICTAQVLLANMAGMYAVYHGPAGLKSIATHVHHLTVSLAESLKAAGYTVLTKNYFDTIWIKTENSFSVQSAAVQRQLNFRVVDKNTIGISFDETCSDITLEKVFACFSAAKVKTHSSMIPTALQRKSSYLTHPIFNTLHSEAEFTRYIFQLQNKDISLTHSMIPLGSCTMKLNATTELMPVSWPEVNGIHPMAPTEQMQGFAEMIKDLEVKLSEITGFPAISVQPNAGSQGEYAGLLVIRKYLKSQNQSHRNICLIPQSAHGTNPASAVMAGMQVVVVQCDSMGNVDINDLKSKAEKYRENLAALMITYPSTHGVFEETITEICQVIHSCGGQVYMDGANLNALVGLCRPGDFGPDVMHMNLHKTFAIPHGGGGPGVGPIGVAEHLKNFLPETGKYSVCSAHWGSASILPISWAYITMMGAPALKEASLIAILNANYIAKKLASHYPILYKGKEGLVAHECIIDLRPLKTTADVDVNDVAKRLMDFGFHAPTMSWPVAGTLMIEPTESESKQELDRFIEAMIQIRQEIKSIENKKIPVEKSPLRQAPHTMSMLLNDRWDLPYTREEAAFPSSWVKTNKYWPPVGRVDNAYGDRNVFCSCPPIEELSE